MESPSKTCSYWLRIRGLKNEQKILLLLESTVQGTKMLPHQYKGIITGVGWGLEQPGVAEVWNKMIFKVPCNPNHFVIS